MFKRKKIKFNKQKIGRLTLAAAVVPAAVISPIAYAASSSASHTQASGLLFENRLFKNASDIASYMLRTNDLTVNRQKVVGDLATSFSNAEAGILNKYLLPDYDPAKVQLAWLTSAGGITNNYQDAVNTYYNPGLTRVQYTDGFGNVFNSADEAQKARATETLYPYLGYYDKVPMFDNNNNIITSGRINPLSKDDVDAYSNNIKNNVENIIINTLGGQAKGGYTVAIDDSRASQAIKDSETNDQKINLLPQITNVLNSASSINKGINGTVVNGDNKITVASQRTPYNLAWHSSGWVYMEAGVGWYAIRQQIYRWNFHYDSDPQKPLVETPFVVQDARFISFDDKTLWRPFYWGTDTDVRNAPAIRPDFGKVNIDDLLKIINLEGGAPNEVNVGLLAVDNQDRASAANINNIFQPFNEQIDAAVTNSKQKIINDYLGSLISPMFYSSATKLSSFLYDKLVNNAPIQLQKDDTRYKADLFTGSFYDGFQGDAKEDDVFSGFKKYVKLRDLVKDALKITSYNNYSYQAQPIKNIIGVNDANATKLLNAIWNWRDANSSLPIVIKKDGHPIFATNLIYDGTGAHIDRSNWQNVSVDNVSGDIGQLAKIFDGIDPSVGGTQTSNTTIDHIMQVIKNIQTIDRFRPNDKPPLANQYDFDEVIKQFLHFFYLSYGKLDDFGKSIAQNRIPKLGNILYLGAASVMNLHLGLYALQNPFLINPSLQSQLQDDILATDDQAITRIINTNFQSTPAEIFTAYNFNGQIINVGNYLYDNENVLRENIVNVITPRRDFEHVFIADQQGYFKNQISDIQHARLYGYDYYFDKYESFRKFLFDWISNNSKEVN